MWKQVGPFRERAQLESALEGIRTMRDDDLPRVPAPCDTAFAIELADRQELRSALLVAEAVAVAALAREESRGAHQRDDFPDNSPRFRANQEIVEQSGALVSRFVPVAGQGSAA